MPQRSSSSAPQTMTTTPSRRPEERRTSKPRKPRPDRHGGHRPPPRRPDASDGPLLLYGVHAVEAALRNPRRKIQRLLLTENAENRLKDALTGRQLAPERVSPRDLDRRLGPDTVHQGVLAEAEELEEPLLADLAMKGTEAGPLVLLDHVTDPHNVGAILRSCAVFGAAGLVMTRRHSPPLDGTLAKSASGALEHIDIALVQNLARALAELKDAGVVTLGLDDSAEHLIEDETFAAPTALVLGAEGKGLRELTRTSCDRLVRVDTRGPIASLNVSNAAAIALHLSSWRRRASKRRLVARHPAKDASAEPGTAWGAPGFHLEKRLHNLTLDPG